MSAPHATLHHALAAHGLKTTSITPSHTPTTGTIILTTAPIPASTAIAHCPRPLLLNSHTLRRFSTHPVAAPTPHALIAAALLAPRPNTPWTPWISTLPASFSTHPLLWPKPAVDLLPPPAKRLLDALVARYKADGEQDPWAWLVVNTRSLHHPTATLTLCPFIDFFNHSSSPRACRAELIPRTGAYRVVTTVALEEGEEVFVTYGQHCGDFLLVEYGFVPGAWDGDYVCVDGWMEVSAEQERLLREEGWWGKWVVDVRGFCYRAEAVARLVVGGERRWRRFLQIGRAHV